MDYEKKYKEFLEKAQKELQACGSTDCDAAKQIFRFFPELNKSEDNMIKEELIKHLKDGVEGYMPAGDSEDYARWLAWVEKQGSEPNWCHHKVDLSNCSEEYRKAYYNGWNNCNQQHSQCKSEENDVVKCLINGMKFYYEGNEEATWGTEKFPMKVRDILSWLEKQGEKDKLIEDKDKLIRELGEYKVKYMQEVLEKHIDNMNNKDDERLRNTTIAFLKDFADKGYENAVECIDWLENKKDK